MRKIIHLKLLQARSLKHRVILRQNYPMHWIFTVVSGISADRYDVTIRKDFSRATCTCPWSKIRHGEICAHIMAAMRRLAVIKERRISFWDDEVRAERQHCKVTPFGRFYITSRSPMA